MFIPPIGLVKKKGPPPPAVAFVGITGTTASAGATLNLSLPGGVIEGDLLIAFMKTGRGNPGQSWTANDGAFAEHFDDGINYGTDDWDTACYSKVAGPAESGPYGFQNSQGMGQRQGMMVAYRNQNRTPFDVSPSIDLPGGSGTSFNIAGVSPATADGLLVLCELRERDGGAGSAQTPTVNPATLRLWQQDSIDPALAMGVFDEQLLASGPTGTRNIQYAVNSSMAAFRLVIARA